MDLLQEASKKNKNGKTQVQKIILTLLITSIVLCIIVGSIMVYLSIQSQEKPYSITVNGKSVNIPSYLIKAGDVIEIREKSKELQRYKDILEVTAGRLVPEWIDVDQDAFKGTIKALPTREQIDVPVDEMAIVELYSK